MESETKAAGGGKSLKKLFTAGRDLLLSIVGLVVMNGVMQLLINPKLELWLGQEGFGDYQSVFAIVAVMGTTFGIAANYSRMVRTRENKDANSDYNLFMLMSAVLCVGAAAVTLAVYKTFSASAFALLSLLMIFTVLRYYSDVWYRMSLNYVGYLIYYLIMTAGYCAGLAVFRFLVPNWMLAILCGEAAAVLFVFLTGKIYRGKRPFSPSAHFAGSLRSFGILSGTNVINSLVQNADRVILRLASGPADVSVFYVATLLGKVVSLLTTPLNGVMIGYLAKYDGKITKKLFAVFAAGILAVGGAAVFACYVGSLILVPLLYHGDPGLIEAARPYFFLANAGQVFFFISNTLMTVLLRLANEKYQMYSNIIYAAVYAALVIPLTLSRGLWGMTAGLIITNAVKFAVVAAIGFAKAERSVNTAERPV